MAIVDIKSAYRAVVIDPDHRRFMGFRWDLNGSPYEFTDNRLCFGLRSGPAYFNDISTFLADILRSRCRLSVVQYLDDFICWDNSWSACQDAQNCIIRLLRFVGFHVSWKKLQPPSMITTYLGITIDSALMELRLLLYKL